MTAIATYYAGTQFRSRLEARWAVFFDLLQWPWVYEPCDFGGWIPDFLLQGHTPVYVEVKPTAVFLENTAKKIDASGCPEEVLLLGTGPVPRGIEGVIYMGGEDGPWRLGWLRQSFPPNEWQREQGWDWGEAVLGCWTGSESVAKNPQGLLGFCHAVHIFNDRITGCYDGGRYGDHWGDECDAAVRSAWREAGNRVQWKPRRP